MNLKVYLQTRLPNRTINIDDETYPSSIVITIDGVKFPLLTKTNDFEAIFETLQNYCFSFADSLKGNDEDTIRSVINEIISNNNVKAFVNSDDLDMLANEIEEIIEDRIKQNDVHCMLPKLALLQKIANELRSNDAVEALGLIDDTSVGYILHFKKCYERIAIRLVDETLDAYELADIYDYLNESPKALGELIKDSIA